MIPTRIAAILLPLAAWAQMNTTPGEFVAEPPTLVSLGFEWKISGDDNRNAHVDVTYRKDSAKTLTGAKPCRCCDCSMNP